jgi:16S rRNA (guanine1207-N2)-methyltransferase
MVDKMDKETEALLKTITVEPGSVVIDFGCSDSGKLGVEIAGRCPSSKVYLLSNNLKTSQVAQKYIREKALQNVSVHLGETLESLGGIRPTIVIIRPSGYEGNKRIKASIVESLRTLPPGGYLYLIANMQKGAPTFIKMVEETFGNHEVLKKGGGGIRIVLSVKTNDLTEEVQIAQPENIIEADILGKSYRFQTGQGLFSQSRVDRGTLLLLESIKIGSPRSILDLGCGYGVIGIVAADRYKGAKVVLVDSDVQAINAAKVNTHLNSVESNTSVILSDGLKGILGAKFDLILSHFPLHIPNEEKVRLLAEIKDAMNPGGSFCLVALSQYDLRHMLQSVFHNVNVIADTSQAEDPGNRYRVLCTSSAHFSLFALTMALAIC